jgi:sulfite exporter TauE/SafE
MLAFGLGTAPALLGVGMLRALASPALRRRVSLASGVLVIAFGVATIARGVSPRHVGHVHAVAPAGATTAPAEPQSGAATSPARP